MQVAPAERNGFLIVMSFFNPITRRDKKLGRTIVHLSMIERQVIPDLFKALVHSVVAQQISRAVADTVWSRLCERLSDITPHNVAITEVAEI